MSSRVVNITTEAEFNAAKASSSLSVFCFLRLLRIPCKQMSSFLDTMSLNYPVGTFYRIDSDATPDLATLCNIETPVPTFKFYKNNVLLETVNSIRTTNLELAISRNI